MPISSRCAVGIDEVGRGPVAGPVTVGVCVVPEGFDLRSFEGIRDSKKLSQKKRESWFLKLTELKAQGKLDFACASVPAFEIDAIGISKAIEKAMSEALGALGLDPELSDVYLDGSLRAPKEFASQQTIIKGDEKVPVISAASIAAKVTRDRYMEEQAVSYPDYGFEAHKGYGTNAHYLAIKKQGVSPLHRKSFLTAIL
ncbi:MAG: ribonuclease HII [Candidatus Taylorbacteria bacterium]|nr:ribonuclease HII [Candidatus Taylorbacteria bacterium]